MKFRNEVHEESFFDLLAAMRYQDEYHQALAYLLTLDEVCKSHVEEIYNIDDDSIVLDALNKNWQTSTSLHTNRLAFNLWNGYTGQELSDAVNYAVDEIFCNVYAPYYWQAIILRYPQYT